MTRETKIGLLVGLAFIIVVAILLSDPVNNASEPPAAIADTAGNVRAGLTVPAPTNPAGQAGATAVIAPTSAARSAGHDALLTRAEAAAQTPHVEVSVGPGNTPLKPIIPSQPADQPDSQVTMQHQGTTGGGDATVTPIGPHSRIDTDILQRAANDRGETLVPANSRDHTSVGATAGGDGAATPSTPTAAGKQRYTAEAGDTVSKLAGRFMGANNKANRAAIIAANPSLKQNPNRVIVGTVYVIPAPAASASASAPPAPPAPPAAAPATPPSSETDAQAPAPDNQPTRWYVVKPNDNLWRIATDEVGDSDAVAQIISLNKDVLKGGDTLHPNMRLRLPPKTVATAE